MTALIGNNLDKCYYMPEQSNIQLTL